MSSRAFTELEDFKLKLGHGDLYKIDFSGNGNAMNPMDDVTHKFFSIYLLFFFFNRNESR